MDVMTALFISVFFFQEPKVVLGQERQWAGSALSKKGSFGFVFGP